MVKNPNNMPAHAEMFDAERIREMEEIAVRYVKFENRVGSLSSSSVPDGTFSDLESNVWSIIVDAVREGVKIGKQLS